ncbi:hypothetical protein SAMN05421780_105138 [Flexibacter flexilis DSM 6793]|uniref:Uncharacterized protein n=1 Tax=Flexibacter flexilis DSM 6793 TaxID=927664 RepID=A0A1I1IYA9_9BACT|nr:hypothetical protein [Flexibacter flexilis]SFC41299.1 hypothetical protein SAMN05421780_105138 [Flexibacter flexilis DSM 6793]
MPKASSGDGSAEIGAVILTPELIGKSHNEIIEYIDHNVVLGKGDSLDLKAIDEACLTQLLQYNSETHLLQLSDDEIKASYYKRDELYTPENYSSLNLKDAYVDNAKRLVSIPNVLSQQEFAIVEELFIAIEDSKKLTNRSDAYKAVKSSIQKASSSIDNLKLDYSVHQGYVSRLTIAVAANSLEYWYQYHQNTQNPPSLPIWVGMDAMGALVGAGVSIGNDWIDGHPINWGHAGMGALGGAIGGSVPSTRWFKAVFV